VAGTLGYGASSTMLARVAAGPASAARPTTNTITWLPPVGAVVRPGQAAYKVDDRPVVLLAGRTPLYGVLAGGVRGADVAMLEANLRAFGYGGFTVDTAYTAATAAAVRRWQRDLGVAQTGAVDVNQVTVAAGAIRVTELKTSVGSDAAGPVLDYTGTTRSVSVPLGASRQHLVRVGLPTTITLPDGTTVAGVVEAIGPVASGGGDEPGGEATVRVTVGVTDQAALGRLDGAPVQLALVTDRREDVLTVPVGALLGLAEGGYGVQVVEGTSSRYVSVQTGMFADGRVEISGPGIAEGMIVGIPA
jgi:peptidoglycan hydrolase-like protein with peptidoglycan-binding domain